MVLVVLVVNLVLLFKSWFIFGLLFWENWFKEFIEFDFLEFLEGGLVVLLLEIFKMIL